MTPGSNERPTRRVLTSRLGDEYVVELTASTIAVRPKRSRAAALRIRLDVGGLFTATIRAQMEAERAAKKKAAKKAAPRPAKKRGRR